MKWFVFSLSFLVHFTSHACSCSQYRADPGSVIESVVRAEFSPYDHFQLDLNKDLVWTKAYPSIWEKINFDEFKGTSCEVMGPNGESLFYCARRRKSDYEVKIPSKNCQMTVRAWTSFQEAKAKVIASTCRQ